jgi:hypothetical protein
MIVGNLSLTETVGSQIVINEDGIGSATVEYFCDKDSAVSAANGMVAHPDFNWLKRKTVTITMEEANAKITATFEGVPPQGSGGTGGNTNPDKQGQSAPKYSLKAGTESIPITQHPNFDAWTNTPQKRKALGARFKTALEPTDTGNSTNKEVFEGFERKNTELSRVFYGVKSYLAPSLVFQESILFESRSVAQTSLLALGRVDQPPDAIKHFVVLPEVANLWLLIGCDMEEIGFGYRVTRQWRLAGNRDGWNPFIYGVSYPSY